MIARFLLVLAEAGWDDGRSRMSAMPEGSGRVRSAGDARYRALGTAIRILCEIVE